MADRTDLGQRRHLLHVVLDGLELVQLLEVGVGEVSVDLVLVDDAGRQRLFVDLTTVDLLLHCTLHASIHSFTHVGLVSYRLGTTKAQRFLCLLPERGSGRCSTASSVRICTL